MSFFAEIRKRARHVIGPALGISAMYYFGYHVIHGERGLIAYRDLLVRTDDARGELVRLSEDRGALQNRVRLLYPGSLDPDLLEERARLMLNYGRPDEIVIIDDVRTKP
ncbi:MAG: septum formation initiator family protein [Rhodospirillales bacterium]|nr:septum formation initiator family protein [Rhodospirillales bacterium]